MKRYRVLVVGILLVMAGCARNYREMQFGANPQHIYFRDPVVMSMPEGVLWRAEKWGFDDYDGDGLEDMVQVKDTALLRQKYVLTLFPGVLGDGDVLAFSEQGHALALPLKKEWWGSQAIKFDAGDVNGDGLADVILSQYISQWFQSDQYVIKVALNQGDGKLVFVEEGDLSTQVLRTVEWCVKQVSTEDESISDYLQLDWADINGDGRDDLVAACKKSRDLYLQVVMSATAPGQRAIAYGEVLTAFVRGYMGHRDADELDMEDLNSDGFADLVLVRRLGRKLVVSPALNTYGSSGNLDFNVEPDTYLNKPQAMGWAFKKTDFLQADGQEGADLVYFGKRSGKPTYAVYLITVD